MTQLEGIDVSNHNGAIDWGKVKKAGKAFAFIKATQGDYFTDPYFTQNRQAAKAAGLLVGAYHFFDPRGDVKAQVQKFCRIVNSIPVGELQPVLDFESRGDKNGLNGPAVPRDACIHAAVEWLVEVKNELGRQPIIYTYPDFWLSDLGNTKRFSGNAANGDPGWPLWFARYAVSPSPLVGGWGQWTFWQYDDHGRCPGVGNGKADCDLNRFNGNQGALNKFAGL